MPRGKPGVRACLAPVISSRLAIVNLRRALIVSALVILFALSRLFANGGAWQTGVPVTGNAAATDEKKTTNVTIEDEKLTIDLHQEFAAVEVRYRMKNTGGQVAQDFFFPFERWMESEDEAGNTLTDLEGYAISADGTELKFETVDAKGAKPRDRFKKVSDTQFAWEFQNLKPTLADDMKIVVHPGYDIYPARGEYAVDYQDQKFRSDYVVSARSSCANRFISFSDAQPSHFSTFADPRG